MTQPIINTQAMIAGMAPRLNPGAYHFCHITSEPDPKLLAAALASFREEGGMALVLPEEAAKSTGLLTDLPMAWITLEVFSALDGVGLTAAVSTALAARGIACNVIAAFHHDHVFVPCHRADHAMAALLDAQAAVVARP